MSVIEDLNLINQYKGDIKQAIIDKGVDMTGTPLSGYAGKIGEIQTGGQTEEITITDNGTYTPGAGVDGYSKVTVNVPKEGDDTLRDLIERDITTISIPAGTTKIGNSAFRGCSNLTSVNIPDSVTSIDAYTFDNCSGLTSINIPDSVTSIGDYAFHYCSNLTSIELPPNINNIAPYTFRECRKLTSINIPDSVTSIGSNAFQYCPFTSIKLPNGLITIGSYAFNYTKLSKIYIPDSLTRFDGYDTFGASGLSYMFFGKDRTTVPYMNNSNIIPNSVIAIYVPESLVESFKSATNWVAHKDKIVGIKETLDIAYNVAEGLSIDTMPATLSYGESHTYTITGVPEGMNLDVDITGVCEMSKSGNTVAITAYSDLTISFNAIEPQNIIKYWTTDDNVISIGDVSGFKAGALLSNSKVDDHFELVFENNITELPSRKFYNMNTLKYINIPKSVKTVYSYNFQSCSNLEYVEFKGVENWNGYMNNSPKIKYFVLDMPYVCNARGYLDIHNTPCKIYVPANLLDSYKSTQYWSETSYVNRYVAIPETINVTYNLAPGITLKNMPATLPFFKDFNLEIEGADNINITLTGEGIVRGRTIKPVGDITINITQ